MVDAVLARIRALATRRLLWLESLASAEPGTGDHSGLPAHFRVALLDLDSPQKEAAFHQRDPRCRDLSTRATAYGDAIASSPDNAFRHVIEALGGTSSEADLLQVCLAAHLDPSIARIYGYLEGDVARRSHATETLAGRLCGYGRGSMWSPAGALARWQVVAADAADPGEPPPLRVDPYILQFLQGSSEIDPELLDCASYVAPRPPLPRWPVDEVSRRLSEALERGMPNRIWLVGQRLSGRRTLAACIARKLGCALVGETAKNLKRLFARAADMNAVLLFDEADALFSKRTEVRDSHDRYANADTNYLLQLIEDYPGVALLATNKRQNIDEAFVRRVRYLMFFPRPDIAQRLAIWRQVVRELAGEDREQALAQDLEHAAEKVEATGAQIKNATLAAMFLARQAARPLCIEDLRRGLERELSNQGSSVSLEPEAKGGRK